MTCSPEINLTEQGTFRTGGSIVSEHSKWHYISKLAQTILVHPLTTTATLGTRIVKLLAWSSPKAALYHISGYQREAASYFEAEYLKITKVARNLLFTPSLAKRLFQDARTEVEEYQDDLAKKKPEEYLQVGYNRSIHQYNSYLHGQGTFEMLNPTEISEFSARSDAALKTVMASHLFQPGMMAVNFGQPNVATFLTEEGERGGVQTVKVDAKSLRRKEMSFHPTNGKIQSGIYVVPTNLPKGAVERYREAAEKLQGRRDITCVNTNCRVLKEAGFSIEGVPMDQIVFPTTFMEHLLFRNCFYTDENGVKHKVHFDLVNTSEHPLEKYMELVDTAVVGTRFRHRRRNADTEENRRARAEAAKALIAEESIRLAEEKRDDQVMVSDEGKRTISVSVPSCLGKMVASLWGRHTIYDVDLSDKRGDIEEAFSGEFSEKLIPFPQANPSKVTRLKRDVLFSGPMIRFLRRHMTGREDRLQVHTKDLFKHLKATKGARLNYALLDDKIVLAKVHVNEGIDERVRKTADWALSKHAILAGRKNVHCSGEMWYDSEKKCFVVNNDSGTYKPSFGRAQVVAELANNIFESAKYGYRFEAADAA